MTENFVPLPEPLLSLMGGAERGAITNFYGPPGSGKTGLCLLAAIECIKNRGKVVYIDTEGGLSQERISQISGGRHKDILKSIILMEPQDFAEQGRMIKSLKESVPDMIILDSAVNLYRLECADPAKEAIELNKDLSVQLSILSSIARKGDIPVILTSHIYKNHDTGENCVIGGDAIKFWSKAMILVEKTGKMSERKATIEKHRSLQEGASAKFMIVNEGIKPSGFRIF
jgi:DNA repair protein RadB